MINNVVLVGRMTKDPELRRTQGGNAVTSFTLAVNRNFESQDGQTADFISCIVWNKVAENVERYCSKGSLVGVTGSIRTRNYDNNQGQKVYVTEVLCNSVQFLETKKANEQPPLSQGNEFYDMHTVGLEKEFDNSQNTFDIMENDIQF